MFGEDLEIRGAVNAGVFDDVARQPGHVVAQQVDRERQAKPGVGQPDAQVAFADANAEVQFQQRDQRQLQAARPTGPQQTAISRARPGKSIHASA